jgi:hypothetical protein
MKFPSISLFGAKWNDVTPARDSTTDQPQHYPISNRVLFIPLWAPSDQLQIVVFPAEVS